MDKNISVSEQRKEKKDLPRVNVGDHVKVYVKIREADKIRSHPFEGTVIAKKKRGNHFSFTVRRISFGEGVEKVFQGNSPQLEKIEVLKSTKVKRAKLYYLRQRVGKKATL